ncbi:tetratricopeptide repeat protein [Amycolatopsis sp. NPDC049688]|uniref:tetratricopeptide repeat protein n=1 Tax=Amycolatopsis sp. NPDC049688 TaxID=3154733 RepID=UPI003419FCFA
MKQLLELLGPAQANEKGADGHSATSVVVSAVSGMGGIGKTALAERTALLAAEQGWFTGGVLRVDLRGNTPGRPPVRPEQTYGWLLRELGLNAEQVPSTIDAQAGAYHQLLDQLATAGQRVLLVLDNAADATQIEDLLPRHPAHRALITTRDVLALPRARRISLDVLPEPDAVVMLTQLLREADPQDLRPDGDSAAVVRLVKLCGRLPLAVEIVAAILIDEQSLPVAELVAQLSDADTRLTGITHAIGDVEAVIDFSYRRLAARDPDAAALLPLLTTNPGPDFATDSAAALANVEVTLAAPRLRVLRAASLLQHTPAGRWRLHDLVALYARSLITPDIAALATTRLLDYYSVTADAADDHLRALPGQPVPDRFTVRQDAMNWFDAEHTNLVAAVAHALNTGHLAHTINLASYLGRYLTWRRFLQDWVTVAIHASTAAMALDHRPTSAAVWNNLGSALQEVRRFDDAITAYEQARDLYQELGDRHGEGAAWNNLGIALQQVRRFDDAITAQQNDLEICQELGDRHGEAMAWGNLGNALQQVRRFDDAITAHEQARNLFQQLGDRHGESNAWNNLGNALRQVRRFDDAITAHEQARNLYQELGDRHGEGAAWNNLGNALQQVRRFDDAITAHEQARNVYQELGDRHRESGALNNLGIALRQVRRFDDAITAYEQARYLYQELGDRHRESGALNNLGVALQEIRRFDDAITAHEQARNVYQELGDRYGEGNALSNLGSALRQVRRFDDAITAYEQARDLYQELGDRHREAMASNNLGNALQDVRLFDDAITAYEQARNVYQELGDRHRESATWNNLGVALQEIRRFDDAITAHEQARNLYQELGDHHREGIAWNNLGNALADGARSIEAVHAWGNALAAFENAGDGEQAARLRTLLASHEPNESG